MDNEKKITKAKKLIADVQKKIDNWNERSQFTLKGVGNLSKCDMDTLVFYSEWLIKNNGYGFDGLMEPRGSIREVFEKYEMVA